MARLPRPEPRVIAWAENGATWLNVAASAAIRPRRTSRREAVEVSVFVSRSKRSASILAPVPHTRFATGVARMNRQTVAGLCRQHNMWPFWVHRQGKISVPASCREESRKNRSVVGKTTRHLVQVPRNDMSSSRSFPSPCAQGEGWGEGRSGRGRGRSFAPEYARRLASNFADADEVVAVGAVVALIAATRRRYAAAVGAVGCFTLRTGLDLEEELGADVGSRAVH